MARPTHVSDLLSDPELRARFTAFLAEEDDVDLHSPTGLSAAGRKAWHMLAEEHGLHSISVGEGFHRIVRVSKKAIAGSAALNTTGMRRFREDFALKINLADARDFDYFIDLYEPHYGARAKLALMQQAMDELGGEQAWKDYQEIPKRRIWAAIKARPGWAAYAADPMTRFRDETEATLSLDGLRVHRDDPFDPGNHDRLFASFDLRSATFNSLRHYDPDLALGHSAWRALLDDFIDIKSRYFHASKTFRLKIFWQLHQPKLMTIAGALITRVVRALHASHRPLVTGDVYWNQDEIVLAMPPEVTTLADAAARIWPAWRQLPSDPVVGPALAKQIKLEVFRLRALSAKRRYFVKELLDTDAYAADPIAAYRPLPSFARVEPAAFAIAYKHYLGLPLDPRDLKLAWDSDAGRFTTTDVAALELDPEVVARG